MSGLAEVLAAHMWADRPGQTCGCGWVASDHWLVDRAQPNRVEQWLAHLATAVLAWFTQRLGEDDVREAAATAVDDTYRWRSDGCCGSEWGTTVEAATDAALTAVRTAIGGTS